MVSSRVSPRSQNTAYTERNLKLLRTLDHGRDQYREWTGVLEMRAEASSMLTAPSGKENRTKYQQTNKQGPGIYKTTFLAQSKNVMY